MIAHYGGFITDLLESAKSYLIPVELRQKLLQYNSPDLLSLFIDSTQYETATERLEDVLTATTADEHEFKELMNTFIQVSADLYR